MSAPEFTERQIFITYPEIWEAMERWAADHRFHLARIPDGSGENGEMFFSDDPDTTPTYAFMPKNI